MKIGLKTIRLSRVTSCEAEGRAEPGPQDVVCGWGRWMPSTSWLATTILSPSPALCAHRVLELDPPTHSSHLGALFFFFFFFALLV